MVQLSHPYMATGKTIALTIWTFVGKVMSLIFNMQSRFVMEKETEIRTKQNKILKMIIIEKKFQNKGLK